MKQQIIGWLLVVIGVVIISFSMIAGAGSKTVEEFMFPELSEVDRKELQEEMKRMSKEHPEKVNDLLVGITFMVYLPKRAEPVGYILGGSFVFAGLVIIIIDAVKRKKEADFA